MKIALAIICKSTEEEAKLLRRCLKNIRPYVDGVFVTATYKKGQEDMTNYVEHELLQSDHVTHFEWCNDFSKARNFNFSQVPKDYDYILWCDADDQFRGLEKLRPTLEENPQTDALAFWYLYEFDEEKQPTVVHKKTMVIKNDGCAEWKGALHEDLCPTRQIDTKFVEGIDRMHFPTENHQAEVAKRNVEISSNDVEANPLDPRVYFNLGNSLIGDGQYEKAKEALEKFVDMSNSSDEKYIATMRIASAEDHLGNRAKAIQNYQIAIGMHPTYSDAYLQLGFLYFTYDDLDNAESYLLNGLVRKPPYHNIIVFNPRDYDYNPMSTLAKVYFRKNRPDLALPMFEGCLKIYPNNKKIQKVVEELKDETKRLQRVVKIVQKLDGITDIKKIKAALKKVPADLQSHPAVCNLRNQHFIKTESSGKDIVYYCGMTTHEWNPIMAKTKGIGGSEEAVINLSKQWAQMGYNVTVYANIGHEVIVDEGVTYRPFWEFNHKDKNDILVLWRNPKLLDYDLNFGKIFVDLHDVIGKGEFNEKRLAKVDKIFVKTNFHRSLFPNVPDEKIVIIPNGMDFELFNQKVKKDPYLLVNTSSPDRSMDVLPELFKRVKEQVPQARLKWAYGWEIFDNAHSDDKNMMAWKNKVIANMKNAGIENMGRLSQKECAKLYLEGSILAYPSEFAEIDCITVKKAQACGCMPITTDFGALDESVQYGIKIHSNKTKDTWSRDFKFSFGIEDEATKTAWVDAVVKELNSSESKSGGKNWAEQFAWPLIAKKWEDIWI